MATITKLIIMVFFMKFISADPTSSFSYNGFDTDLKSVSSIALFGDAEFVNGSSSSFSSSWVQLTGSASLSCGLMLYKKPIKLIEGKPRKIVSFSSNFTFSISPKNGDGNGGGLAFVVVPIGYPLKVFGNCSFGLPFGSEGSGNRVFAVEFDTFKDDDKFGDLNENHVGIDIGSVVSVKVSNASVIDLVLNSGKKLSCWIDYEASSKQLEVRLSKFGNKKPIVALLTYPVDISKVLKVDEVFMGLSSSNGNSSQTCLVHSWSFKVRHAFQWMHSQPLNPNVVNLTEPLKVVHKRSSCALRIIVALVVGTGCGALGAILVLYVWTMFGSRRPVAPEEMTDVHPVEYEYKKINLVYDEAVKDDGKK